METLNYFELSRQIESKKNLLHALFKVREDNSLFIKDDQREKGKEYSSSEKLLASIQKPLNVHGVLVEMIESKCFIDRSYESIKAYQGEKSIKDCKARCVFAATHIDSGETLVYAHESVGVADGQTTAADAVEAAKTRCIGSFVRGLMMVPKLSRNDFDKTKDTLDMQKRISDINKKIELRKIEDRETEHG